MNDAFVNVFPTKIHKIVNQQIC